MARLDGYIIGSEFAHNQGALAAGNFTVNPLGARARICVTAWGVSVAAPSAITAGSETDVGIYPTSNASPQIDLIRLAFAIGFSENIRFIYDPSDPIILPLNTPLQLAWTAFPANTSPCVFVKGYQILA